MEIDDVANGVKEIAENASLAETIKNVGIACQKCRPLSMLECVNNCVNWRLKNEFRGLHKSMQDMDFVVRVLNSIKNTRRQQILSLLSRRECSVVKLQQQLRTMGYSHSQATIEEEYLGPLVEAQLVSRIRDDCFITKFGSYLCALIQRFPNIGELLPPHSECYEELILANLLDRPKTFEELKATDTKMNSIMRVLSRLEKSGLVSTGKDRDHIFFFRSKRNPQKEVLSSIMKQVYESLPDEGIAAGKLAQKVGISLRRTYKYVRHLKGKKLVFVREKPRTYALTNEGVSLAEMLIRMHEYEVGAFILTEQLISQKEVRLPTISRKINGKGEKSLPFMTSILCVQSP